MTTTSQSSRLVQRHCGGWLALAPLDASLKIGGTASSEAEERERYQTAVTEWHTTLVRGGVRCHSGRSARRSGG